MYIGYWTLNKYYYYYYYYLRAQYMIHKYADDVQLEAHFDFKKTVFT